MKDGLPVILFKDEEHWSSWLEENSEINGVWVRIAKKNSGVTSISYQEAVDVGICYGWIDGLKQKFDDKTYVQRFTPRKPKSNWSKINKVKALQFIAEGKMTPAGLATIENAKKAGTWDKAYDSQSTIKVPADFQIILKENPEAEAFFNTLNSVNRFAILYRIQTAKTSELRKEKMKKFAEMLSQKKKIHD